MEWLLTGAAFVGTLGLVVGLFVFVNRRQLAAASAARARLLSLDEAAAVRGILRDESVSDLPFLNRLLAGRSFTDELAEQLTRAGSKQTPGGFLITSAAAGMVGLLVGMLLWGTLIGVVCGAIAAALPLLQLNRRVKKRREKFEAQLPDAIDMLVTAMRAGYSFQQAMKFIGDEVTDPLGPEFARFYDEQRLGVDVRTALLSMQDRVPSLDFKMLATAVLIQRETGGMLSEVLSNISNLMRERVAVRAQIATLTSEPKLSARILSALPVVVYIGLFLADREYVKPLTESTVGHVIVAYAVLSVAIGYWLLMQIADVDF